MQPKVAALCAPGSAIGLISYGRLAQFIHTGFVRVDRLPRNQMGKIERSRLSKLLCLQNVIVSK
jgi:hypothetical protein